MSAGAGTGVRGAGIREFGNFKNVGIRVRGDSANIDILRYILYMYFKSYIYI